MTDKRTRTRDGDPQKFEMTPNEFAHIVRNGGNSKARFDWQGWIKTAFVVVLPFIALVTYINQIDGNVERNTEGVERNEQWIDNHTTATGNLKQSIHELDSKQGIILEKITRAQKDIEKLVREIDK